MRGVNYIPSYAHDTIDIWRMFNRDIVDRELGFAEDMGFNCTRIFINYHGYKKSKKDMLRAIGMFVDLCEKHNLKCILIPFDSFCVDLYDRSKDIAYATSFLQNCLFPVEDMKTFESYWRRFLSYPQSPGYTMLDPKYWDQLKTYLSDLIEPYRKDSRILAWDIMNEPWAFPIMDQERIMEFVEHMCHFSKKIASSTPITLGLSSWSETPKVEKIVDLISFHIWRIDEYDKVLSSAKKYEDETGKPVLLTEFGSNFFFKPPYVTDSEQLRFYKKFFPKIVKSGIGWLIWEFIVGSDAWAHCGIVYPNGHKRPAGKFLLEYLKEIN